MAFFTTVLQRQVNDVWRKKINQADAQMQLYKSGKEIRDYLNDHSTLSTAGFVIRRHLQKLHTDVLERVSYQTGLDYADLSSNLNIPWPEEFNLELAKALKQISKGRGVSISAKTWMSYLDDAPIKMYKDTPFKVSFALSMDVETTEELLMACGQDTYCFRNPNHFIYYYCQNRPGVFSWAHAQKLLTGYQNGLQQNSYNANDASGGMTQVLRSDIKRLFSSSASDQMADEELLLYMRTHQKEFSGLSLTARSDFLRMARYLAILYPTYDKVIRIKDPVSGETTETIEECPVVILPDGTPKLSDLVRALFSTGGWLPTTIGKYTDADSDATVRTASSVKRRQANTNIEYRRAQIDENTDRPFMNSVQYFVDSYAHHLDAIERVYRRPANPGNVERRDVILFTYFFIRRYPELLKDEDSYGKELDELTSLVYDDMHIDPVMDYLMDELYTITSGEIADAADGSYDEGANTHDYIELFNEVLARFGMKGMYMPNPWDRFITMSLFAEDPDFFTEAVLWNTVDENDEQNEEVPAQTEVLKNNDPQAPQAPRAIMVKYPPATPSVIYGDGRKKFLVATLCREKTQEYISVNKSCFVFGRKSQSAYEELQSYGFSTDRKNISRNHVLILFHEGCFYLADISRRGETWLNGEHLTGSNVRLSLTEPVCAENAYPLHSGDKIRLGKEEFGFYL